MRQSPLRSKHPDTTQYEVIGDTEVPWAFSGVDGERDEIRRSTAVIDCCGNGLISVTGETGPLLARILARDVEYLAPEQCTTSLILDDSARPIDIVVVYGLEDGVLIETSVGNGERTAQYLQDHAEDDVQVTLLSDTHTVIGIEGPYAWGVVGRLIDQELGSLPFETAIATDWNGHEILFARSGSTSEYGYKVIADNDTAREFWEAAIDEATPVGQGGLEVAMLEVRQPILHREFTEDDNVLTCGWNWLVDLSKEDAIGRAALDEQIAAGVSVQTIGFSTNEEVAVEVGATVYAADEQIGHVVYAVHSSGLGTTLGLARIDSDFAAAGLSFAVGTGSGTTPVTSLASPYVIPTSWSVPIF